MDSATATTPLPATSTLSWLTTLESLLFIVLRPLLLCNFGRKVSALSTRYITDEDILQAVKEANSFVDSDLVAIGAPGRVSCLGTDAVAKNTVRAERQLQNQLIATNLVRSATSIPVPLCDRVIPGRLKAIIVEEYIPGTPLHHLWPTLSWWSRFRVILTLRFYILELRSMASRIGQPSFPGPVSADNQPQYCKGRLFSKDDHSGPFESYEAMSRWYQNRLLLMQKFKNASPDIATFDDTAPLVFTHMDIHPFNLILGDDGQLWMIDWEDAGWYPSWFEGASMHLFSQGRNSEEADPTWVRVLPYIAGTCQRPGQIPFMLAIQYTLLVLNSNIIDLIGAPAR